MPFNSPSGSASSRPKKVDSPRVFTPSRNNSPPKIITPSHSVSTQSNTWQNALFPLVARHNGRNHGRPTPATTFRHAAPRRRNPQASRAAPPTSPEQSAISFELGCYCQSWFCVARDSTERSAGAEDVCGEELEWG